MGVATMAVDDAGAPRILRAVKTLKAPKGSKPEAAALGFVKQLTPLYVRGSEAADIAPIAVQPLTDGSSVVLLSQRVGGVELQNGSLRVLLRPDQSLAAVSGTIHSSLGGSKAPAFAVDASQALSNALSAEYKVAIAPTSFKASPARGDLQPLVAPPRTDLRIEDAVTKRVYVSTASGLQAAWRVEFYGKRGGGTDALRYVIAADSGKVLERVDLKANETFIYRAYADATGERRPFDGPLASYNPHPTGFPDDSLPAPVPANLVAVDGLNRFRDPWLPDDSTITAGNNVFAFSDHDNNNTIPNGPPDLDVFATVSSPGLFDWAYRHDQEPQANARQVNAAIVNLFYMINWMHDWYYESGFTEATFNAQLDNYGRGAADTDFDPILANAQDDSTGGGSRNNANMSTPSDGVPPRMQMYLWSGAALEASIAVTPAGLNPATAPAGFGLRTFDQDGEIVYADDGTAVPDPGDSPPGSTHDGCQTPTNVTGKIALIDRGSCSVKKKVKAAQTGGAIGVIIVDNRPAPTPPGPFGNDATITGAINIGALTVRQVDGNAIKAALATAAQNAHLHLVSDVERDGDLDNGVIAHEWGHYMHHRLTNCDNTTQCGAMSEGWGDFVALHMQLRPEDNAHGAFTAGGVYDTLDGYFGVRRYAYSVDPTKNNLSFRHIQRGVPVPTDVPNQAGGDNAEVHSAGEIWCSMLWEAYVSLIDHDTYPVARRRMSNYVVAGLLMAPPDATYTETRDAILAAASTVPGDEQLIAEAFARRGAGSCAVSPPPESEDLVGVVEDSHVSGHLVLGRPTITDDDFSCDDDDYLDPGERGILKLTVSNAGPQTLTAVTITASSTVTGVTAGAPVEIASMAPFTSQDIQIPVRIGLDAPVGSRLTLKVTGTGTNDCATAPIEVSIDQPLGVDDAVNSKTDDVEPHVSAWTPAAGTPDVWTRKLLPDGNHVWNGLDSAEPATGELTSPILQVSATDPLAITFQHRYQFEFGAPATFYDGGVIEVSEDDGTTWKDVLEYDVDPGYVGLIATTGGGNPLEGRPAFVANNEPYPDFEPATVDFANKLAGKSVRIRFRVATDTGTGRVGWDIDDIAVTGIDNTPFNGFVDEGPTCQQAPTVNAGPDQTVVNGAVVNLAGTVSDPNGDTFTVAWTQTAGPTVTLTGADTLTPSFTAPPLAVDTPITFELSANDGYQTATDSVTITVSADAAPVVNAGEDRTVAKGALVTLAGTATDADGNPLTFAWTQTAGPTVALTGADTLTPSFTAPALAADTALTFELSASDGFLAATDSVTITVTADVAPVANAGDDRTVAAGARVVVTGTGTDADSDPLTFAWTQTAGPTVEITDADKAEMFFTAPSQATDSTLTFRLTVSDGLLEGSDEVTITVRRTNQAPTANAGDDAATTSGTVVHLTGTASDPDGDTLTYAWTEVTTVGITITDGTTLTPTFTAPVVTADTDVTLRLTVSDGRAEASDEVTIKVSPANAKPTVNAGPDQEVLSAAAVALAGTASDADGDALTYAWTQTAGPAVVLTGGTGLTPTFTAPTVTESTALTFKLTATDARGADNSDEVTITVKPQPPTPDAGMPDAGPDAGTKPDAGKPMPDPDDGCGCASSSPRSMGNLLVPLAAVAFGLRRRRRK